MANPYMPRYTPAEQTALDTGRAALLARWNAPPFVPAAGPKALHEFRVERDQAACLKQLAEGAPRTPCDVYLAHNAPEELPDAWLAERKRVPTFKYEFGARPFAVYVPHTYYVRRWYAWQSVDRACARDVACLLLLAGGLVAAAGTLLLGGGGGASSERPL